MNTDNYVVQELTYSEKERLYENPLFSNVINRVSEMIASGEVVESINIYTKTPIELLSSGDANSTSYWESYCPALGTYNGYKFLYLESEVIVRSTTVKQDDIDPSIDWQQLLKAFFKLSLIQTVNNKTEFKIGYSGILNNFISSISIPLKVTYNQCQGFSDYQVNGTLYMRDVLIRDDHNRVKGYAYYIWGHTEMTKLGVYVNAMWPVSQRTATTYNYNSSNWTCADQISYTPGFYGNPTLYNSIILLYNNDSGYFTHSEQLDTYSIVYEMIRNA